MEKYLEGQTEARAKRPEVVTQCKDIDEVTRKEHIRSPELQELAIKNSLPAKAVKPLTVDKIEIGLESLPTQRAGVPQVIFHMV